MTSETRVRLSSGTNPSTGRLEVYHNKQWGTVCSDSFAQNDGRVVCNMLGYNTTYVFIEKVQTHHKCSN